MDYNQIEIIKSLHAVTPTLSQMVYAKALERGWAQLAPRIAQLYRPRSPEQFAEDHAAQAKAANLLPAPELTTSVLNQSMQHAISGGQAGLVDELSQKFPHAREPITLIRYDILDSQPAVLTLRKKRPALNAELKKHMRHGRRRHTDHTNPVRGSRSPEHSTKPWSEPYAIGIALWPSCAWDGGDRLRWGSGPSARPGTASGDSCAKNCRARRRSAARRLPSSAMIAAPPGRPPFFGYQVDSSRWRSTRRLR